MIPGGQYWVLHLHPIEAGRPSKIGLYDEPVVFDLPQHRQLGEVFNWLRQGNPGDSLVGMSSLEFNAAFKTGVVDAEIQDYEVVPYALRHSGPSGDRASGVRSLGDIKKRGRWGADSSVRRYEKSGRLLEAINNKMGSRRKLLGSQAMDRKGDLLMGRWLPSDVK